MNRIFFRPVYLLYTLLILLCVFASGCAKPSLIPNTKVQDTALNREILQVVEQYRKAVEARNAPKVLALVHPTYQDNGGTPDGNDDMDYEGLKKLLASRFTLTTKIRYQIEYQDVQTKGREAAVYAYIDATFVYEPPNTNPRWRRLTDHNRFRLIKEGKEWRFIGGL